MKYLLLVLSLISLLRFDSIAVHAESQQFARIKLDNTYFYSAPIDDTDSKMFKLPVSYFVLLKADENDSFYKAEYMEVSGYVKKSEVQPVKGAPISPYANKYTFRVFAESGLHLRSSPKNTALNIIETVKFLDTNLIFYGSIEGEEAISYKGKTWYFAKYIKGANVYFGYLYAVFCDMLKEIEPNTEELVEISNPIFDNTPDTSAKPDNMSGLSQPVQIIIIVGVSLTCLLIIYLLFKPTKIAVESNGKSLKFNKKRIKRLHKSDYYEIDDQ